MKTVVAAIGVAVLLGLPQSRPAARYDLAIVGGRVLDGSGAPPRRADVAIVKDRIAAIGTIAVQDAREVIDAAGLIVAPGFIDVHTHADDLESQPLAENFVRMGVTTIVAGNCGSSALDVGEALASITRTGAAINFATLIGHNTVRQRHHGLRRSPSHHPGAGEDAVARLAGDGRRCGGLLDRPAIRARHVREGAGGHRSGTRCGECRRRLRHAHAQRRHGARSRGRRVDSRRLDDWCARPDFASQGGQPEPVGRERKGAGDDRCRARPRRRRHGRSVRVHGGQLDARHPLSVLGARRWSAGNHRAPE